jgi:RNA polymerase sigma factor (TIGR02999 family)
MSDVTQILNQIESGNQQASEELLPLVYEELRKLAAARMASERADHTLQATALVHEAYVRLVNTEEARNWDSRGHFFSAAAEAMRRILVDNARRKNRPKHGGGIERVELPESVVVTDNLEGFELLDLNDALEALATKDPRKAELVKLRFFVGLSGNQAAQVLGIADSTADLDWAYAKTWLRVAMSEPEPDEANL